MKKKNISTDHMCMLLKKCPMLEPCHHAGPFSARIVPVRISDVSAAIDSTPKM